MFSETALTLPHYTFEKVEEGVFGAIRQPGTGAMGNAAIVDLGESTLVFDTSFTPEAALDLLTASRELTGRDPQWVVNSHEHGDHVYGNGIFQGAKIISTALTRAGMIARLARLPAMAENAPVFLAEMQKEIDEAKDEARRGVLANNLTDFHALVRAFPDLHVPLPELTFESHLTLFGKEREVRLLSMGGGHTKSDLFAFLPETGTLLSGDLVQVRTHPLLAHGNPDTWRTILDHLLDLPVEKVIPGHGRVGGPGDIALIRDYIGHIEAVARKQGTSGGVLDGGQAIEVPLQYRDWDVPSLFASNVQFMAERLNPTA